MEVSYEVDSYLSDFYVAPRTKRCARLTFAPPNSAVVSLKDSQCSGAILEIEPICNEDHAEGCFGCRTTIRAYRRQMSKAFVREEDVSDDPLPPARLPLVPPGTKNYVTATGATRLQEELQQLQTKRSAVVARADDPEARMEAQGLDHRIRHLQHSLRTAEVVSPAREAADTLRFGSTVTVRDQRGVEARYQIVGVDETDHSPENVSWLSPFARALLNAGKGQRVRVKIPRGESEIEILAVA